MSDAYSILGVSRTATASDIRRAYHRLALLTHPDKLPPSASHAERASSEERFKQVASAYEVLSDADKRAQYDAGGLASAWGHGAHQRSSRETFRAFFGAWDDDMDAGADQASAGSSCGVIWEEREAEDAINLPLFEGYLVLDPTPALQRSSSTASAGGSVATSVACTMEDITALGWEGWFARAAENGEFSHERPSPVVVLGGDVAMARSLAEFLTSCASRDQSSLSAPLRNISTHCRHVWFIRGGADALLSCLPCLHASLPQQPTPHVIAPGLLLGSRAVPWDAHYMSAGLGVTHVIIAQDDTSVSAVPPGVRALALHVSDDGTDERVERLFSAWASAVAFIDSATQAGGRVLVRVHGRSRSASIVLAWMSMSHALPVAMAARILRSKCPSIDWTLANLETVVEWSRSCDAKALICAQDN
jgi:curved DNA-binding protein CbpA